MTPANIHDLQSKEYVAILKNLSFKITGISSVLCAR